MMIYNIKEKANKDISLAEFMPLAMERIVVLGGGESGVGAAVLAKKCGFDVFLSDLGEIKPEYKAILGRYGIEYEEHHHTEELILNAREIVKSPGISDKAPIIQAAVLRSIPIISEIELAGRYTDAKMICITGSNGKTTTTMLTYHILRQAGLDVGLAGNVGASLALQIVESPHKYYVIELSSFQLDNMYDFKADIAILLNITPDHLDRYHYEFQNYVDAKFRILQNQTADDAFIFWNDDPVIAREIEKRHPQATLYPFSKTLTHGLKEFVKLKGLHNLYNSVAAGIAARLVGVDDEQIRRSFADFNGVEHRLEKAGQIDGVEYINDSKATNVNSCWYALQSFDTPIVLILGGTDKGNDYSEIEQLVCNKVRALVYLGIDNNKLHSFFDGKVLQTADARSMEEAVGLARSFAVAGDVVLLSPCCASFDLFNNYEDRGRQFKECVKQLKHNAQ